MLTTRHGPMFALAGDTYITRSLQVYGEYGRDEADLFRQIVKPGMTVVEAGANIGTHSVMLARACAPARLFAFEPQQRVFQILCANLVLNGVRNAITLPDAVGADAGTAMIPSVDYASDCNFGSVSIRQSEGADWASGQPTRVVTIDDLALTEVKTKQVVGLLKALTKALQPAPAPEAAPPAGEESLKKAKPKPFTWLVGTVGYDKNVYLSARNIHGVEVLPADQFNAYTVLKQKRLLLTKAALEALRKGKEPAEQK